MTIEQNFEQFTEQGYRNFLRIASRSYCWEFFGTSVDSRHIILRHDVDLSPHRALALAQIEHEEAVRSTFLFMLHSEFYNLLEPSIITKIKSIGRLGHRIGLHFDLSFYDRIDSLEGLTEKLHTERLIIETMCDAKCDVFSFHNPDTNSSLDYKSEVICEMYNAYSAKIHQNYKYISDSNGYWRFENLFDVVENASHDKIHVLVHPEWWTPDALSPRRRVERAVRCRGDSVLKNYDDNLKKWNRINVA